MSVVQWRTSIIEVYLLQDSDEFWCSEISRHLSESQRRGWTWYKVLAVRRFSSTYYISKSLSISVVVRQEAICENPTVGSTGLERVGGLFGDGTTERRMPLVSKDAFRVTERQREEHEKDRGWGQHLLSNPSLLGGCWSVSDVEMKADFSRKVFW